MNEGDGDYTEGTGTQNKKRGVNQELWNMLSLSIIGIIVAVAALFVQRVHNPLGIVVSYDSFVADVLAPDQVDLQEAKLIKSEVDRRFAEGLLEGAINERVEKIISLEVSRRAIVSSEGAVSADEQYAINTEVMVSVMGSVCSDSFYSDGWICNELGLKPYYPELMNLYKNSLHLITRIRVSEKSGGRVFVTALSGHFMEPLETEVKSNPNRGEDGSYNGDEYARYAADVISAAVVRARRLGGLTVVAPEIVISDEPIVQAGPVVQSDPVGNEPLVSGFTQGRVFIDRSYLSRNGQPTPQRLALERQMAINVDAFNYWLANNCRSECDELGLDLGIPVEDLEIVKHLHMIRFQSILVDEPHVLYFANDNTGGRYHYVGEQAGDKDIIWRYVRNRIANNLKNAVAQAQGIR